MLKLLIDYIPFKYLMYYIFDWMEKLNIQEGEERNYQQYPIANPYQQFGIAENYLYEYGNIYNGTFGNQFYNGWPNRAIQYPYQQYYGYYNHSYVDSAENINKLLPEPLKATEEFALARTADSLLPSQLTRAMPFFMPPHQIQQNVCISQNYPCRGPVICDNEQEFDETDQQPIIKLEQQNSQQDKAQQQKRLKKKLKNQTKNIPKNYGKAMISFVLSHLDWIQSQFGIQNREDLIAELKKRKNSINAIVHMKDLWTTSKYSREFRILSSLFIRKYSFAYIFNSRVSNYSTHIKYKYKLLEALRSPGNFSRIKEY